MLIGIGFIKVGIILKVKLFNNKDSDNPLNRKVVNLTISASTWFAGAIGMEIGFNFYFIAIITIAFAVIVPSISQLVKNRRKLITKLDMDVARVNINFLKIRYVFDVSSQVLIVQPLKRVSLY